MRNELQPLSGDSNVQREANNMGVRVTSSKTFLTFEAPKEIASSAKGPTPLFAGQRRFTTNEVLSGKLLEQIASIDSEDKNESMESRGDKTSCDSSRCDSVYTPPSALNTTVMIRNVPNRFSQDELIAFLRMSGACFNFFYCPIDFRNRCNIGYFFINLTSPAEACVFFDRFHGYQLPACRSTKVCEASWARIQGYLPNVDHYRNSPIMQMKREFRPRVFSVNGEEMVFPGQNNMAYRTSKPNATRKLFVGGLAPGTTANDIEKQLLRFGAIEDVTIILDSTNKVSRGFAFVTFVCAESVEICSQSKEYHFIDGRSVGIRPYAQTH